MNGKERSEGAFWQFLANLAEPAPREQKFRDFISRSRLREARSGLVLTVVGRSLETVLATQSGNNLRSHKSAEEV